MEILKKIRYKYLDIKYGILQVLKWLPVIYKDRDWDHVYFYTIINEKLKHMIKNFENPHGKNCEYVGMEKDIKQMRLCSSALGRLIEDDHTKYAKMIEYNNRGIDTSLYSSEDLFKDSIYFLENHELKIMLLSEYDITPEKIFINYTDEQYRELFNKITHIAFQMYQDDLEYFTDIIKNYSEGWWL